MNKKKHYDNQSITSLKGADRVRLRPGVIFGSDGVDGCCHSMFEILSNSIDEAREGYGNTIIVTRFLDKSIEIEDFARGVPVDFNENEKRFNWELVYCELYAGGKYDNLNGDNYEYSLGLNGLGACAAQYSSEYMDVVVYRDGKRFDLHFEKGENIGGLKQQPDIKDKTGTITRWRPDLSVFVDIDIPLEYYQNTLKKQAVVNKGLKFTLKNEVAPNKFEQETYFYKQGIVDYLNEILKDTKLITPIYWQAERIGRDREDKPDYKVKMEFAFSFSNTEAFIEYYHNSSWLEHGGSPDKAVKNAFVYTLDSYMKDNGKYQKDEPKITYKDVFDCLVLISNSFSTQTSYENQTKKSITNKFIQDVMTTYLKHQLEVYFIENKAETERICDQVLINKRSREKAEKERINIKKKLSANSDPLNKVEKFIPCRSKKPEERELYIVEGDSAAGSCQQGRNAIFQAIMPVRGKILNCLKSDYNKIFANDIITDLLRVLGCGVEIRSRGKAKDLDTFSLKDLQYNKVIICTDADVDGFQIRTLILTMLFILTPALIEEGKIYIAETPLYEISTAKDSFFAYNEKEKTDILKKLENKKYSLQRSKGLGENTKEMMALTTMNPATRRLIQVTPDEASITMYTFEMLLGNNLEARKNYIADHGSEYLEMLDI